MNRAGRPSFTLSTLFALLALSLLVACGGGDGGDDNNGRPDTTGSDASDSGGTTDTTPPDAGGDDSGSGEVVAPECEQAIDCEGQVEPGPCETFTCVDGVCGTERGTEPPDCCLEDAECDDGDPNTADSCPTPGEVCQFSPVTCVDDPAVCDELEVGPCEEAVCNEDTGQCEPQRVTEAPACCIGDEECDDGDENTRDSCPDVGGECVFAPFCDEDDDCTDAFDLDTCEFAFCDTENESCAKDRVAPEPNGGCCVGAFECDDGDPETIDSCPEPGGPCLNVRDVCTDAPNPDQFCVDRLGPADTCEVITCNLATAECEVFNNRGEQCCITLSDCPDGDGWSCPEVGGQCQREIECEDNFVEFEADFEGYVADYENGVVGPFEIFDQNLDDAVTWHIVDDEVYAGSSIYVGDPDCGWYFNGDEVVDCETEYAPEQDADHATRVDVELVTGEIVLQENVAYALGFWVQGESETPMPGLPDEFQPDTLVISVEDTSTGFLDVVFRSSDYGNVIPQPLYVGADLTTYAGRAIRVHFEFDTFDGSNNRLPGWWLDDIAVRSICGQVLCEQNADCEDTDGCSVDVCTPFENGDGGFCADNLVAEDCQPCDADDDCVSDDDCIIGSCIPEGQPLEGTCAWEPSGAPECCSEIDVIDATFDGSELPEGWSVEDDGSDVKWQLDTTDDERTALYFGDPVLDTYNNGARAFGRVSTGPIALPDPGVTPFVSLVSTWELRLSTEFDDETWNPNVAVDRLTLFLAYEDETGATVEDEVWSSAAVEGTTLGEWVAVGTDLTAYAGRTVEFVFEFDSDDELSNDYGGAWIDAFMVRASCRQPCVTDDECDDAELCTVDACVAGTCTNTFAYPDCCEVEADCGAGNDCTAVTCADPGSMGIPGAGVCTYRDDNDDQTCCDDDGGVTYANEIPVEDLESAGYAITMGDHGDALNAVMWQASDTCMVSPPYGLYFGDEVFESYESGYQVSGAVTTPELRLPSSGPSAKTWLEFELFLDTEWRGAQFEGWVNPPPVVRDELKLYIVRGDQATEVWSSFSLDFRGSTCPPNEECGWQTVRVDMTAYQTYALKLRFAFDSVDDIDNGGLGACIDDIRIVTDCTGQADIECFASEQCNDDDPCTWDFCLDDFTCSFPQTGDPDCCTVEEIVAYDWNDGTDQGWTFSDAIESVGWYITDFLDLDGSGFFLYFGDPAAENYDADGQTVAGLATSAPVQLPDSDEMTVTFDYYLDVEPPSANFPNRDAFEVRIISNFTGAERVLVSKSTIPVQNIGATPRQWFTWTGGIPTEFAGDNVVFEISFNSDDEVNNTTLGVLVDSFLVEGEICP